MMKYILIGCSMIVGMSCKDSVQNTIADTASFQFSLDAGAYTYDSLINYADFDALFAAQQAVVTDNFSILNADKSIYQFGQHLGDVVLHKKGPQQYELLERYIVPVGSVYAKFALMRFKLDMAQQRIVKDDSFEPQLGIYKYWSNHIVKEYDSYLKDSTYTASSLETIPHQAFENMRYLMFNLTLASILEDCKSCQKRMQQITSDFPLVNKKEFDQNIRVCQTILSKFFEESH